MHRTVAIISLIIKNHQLLCRLFALAAAVGARSFVSGVPEFTPTASMRFCNTVFGRRGTKKITKRKNVAHDNSIRSFFRIIFADVMTESFLTKSKKYSLFWTHRPFFVLNSWVQDPEFYGSFVRFDSWSREAQNYPPILAHNFQMETTTSSKSFCFYDDC
jgi:hypothetical protein